MISTEEALGRAPLSAGPTLPYGDHPAQVGELRIPPGTGPHPVIVLVHGGCWRSLAGRSYIRDMAADLTLHRWATWSLGFRRVDEPGGSWPGIFRDMGAGADHLRSLASDFLLDLGRVAALGHSSGGHLALWLAGRHRIPAGSELATSDPLPIHSVVSLGGIADLASYHALEERACQGGVVDLLGARPGERLDRWNAADPGRLLPLGVPQLLVHGEHDPDVPPAHARAWARKARAAGDSAEMQLVPHAGHFEVVAPWWSGWSGVRSMILDFLARTTGQPRRG